MKCNEGTWSIYFLDVMFKLQIMWNGWIRNCKVLKKCNRTSTNLDTDEDIGDEFMNSWKSISVAEDDMVDFSFGTVSKGKNKAFDFGTL